MLREFRSTGAGEALDGEGKPPMEIAGRPPANPMVVPIRSRTPWAGTEPSGKFTVTVGLTALNRAIGNAAGDGPAVNVPTFQVDIRTSDGCMVSMRSAFSMPCGVPSKAPIWNSVPLAGVLPDSV